MTDSRRGSAEGTSPLTHADAEALISARLDGPLDQGQNRSLLAHLAGCDSCRAFASQLDMMATAVRDIPSLPPSAAVSRRVRSEIRGESNPMRRFGLWLTTSKSAPVGALAAAVVALALVSASVFGPLGDDGSNGPSVNAPEFAAMETETSLAEDDDTGDFNESSNDVADIPNIKVTENSEAPSAAFAQETTDEPVDDAAAADQESDPAEASDDEEPASNEQEAPVSDGTAPEVADSSVDSASTGDGDSSGANASEPSEADASSAREQAATGATLADGTGGSSNQVQLAQEPEATETSEPEPTATEEAAPTNTAEPEPSATTEPSPTETVAPTETATIEPTATAEPTETEEPLPSSTPATPEPVATSTPATPEPEPTSTATPEPTATNEPEPTSTEEPEPTATSEPEPTETPADDDSPSIVPRGGGNDDEDEADAEEPAEASNDGTTIVSSDAGADSTSVDSGTGSGGTIDSTDDAGGDESETQLAESDPSDTEAVEEEAAPESPEPIAFTDLDAVGTMGGSGLLLPGNGGYYAVERPGGGLAIVAADGTLVTSGWGYNPVWSQDGQLIYAADGSLSEGAAALISWAPGDGQPSYVTTGGEGFDTPAGAADGGLYYIRYQPGAEFSLQLRFTAGEDTVVWEGSGYALVGQGIYLYGGEVFVPTDQGWIAIPTSGGEPRNVGSVIGGEYDLLIDPATGMIAFVSGDAVHVAPATSPGSAMFVGSLGNGGFAWTPWGLALASGESVSIIYADGRSTQIVVGGGDLTAPVWTGESLLVADAADGGTMRSISAAAIEEILAG